VGEGWGEGAIRLATLKGHSGPVSDVAFAPDGRTIASAGCEGTIALWDAETGRVRATLAGHPQLLRDMGVYVKVVAFAPDGATLASTALLDPNVRLWDVATGRLRATLPQEGLKLSSLAFAPDGRVLATAGDHTLTFWDVRTGQARRTWPCDRHPFSAVAFSPDGAWLALGGVEGEVLVWEMARVFPARGGAGTRPTF
jgi:WD40 repeat protein